jgi:hypothetical protein
MSMRASALPLHMHTGRRDIRKGRRKPSVPSENESTGGTGPARKSEDACRIVPSPPSVRTRSMGGAPGPEARTGMRTERGQHEDETHRATRHPQGRARRPRPRGRCARPGTSRGCACARAQPPRVARGAPDKLGDARAGWEHVRRLLADDEERADRASASLAIFRPARVRRVRVGAREQTHVECGRLVTRPRVRRTVTICIGRWHVPRSAREMGRAADIMIMAASEDKDSRMTRNPECDGRSSACSRRFRASLGPVHYAYRNIHSHRPLLTRSREYGHT